MYSSTSKMGSYSEQPNMGKIMDVLSYVPQEAAVEITKLIGLAGSGGYTYNPGYYPYYPPGGVIPTPTPTPTPLPVPPQGTVGTPSSPPSNLFALMSAIPIAYDGQVITSEYHNRLRAAIWALADQLGVTPGGEVDARTFSPAFLQNADGPNWRLEGGVASVTGGDGNKAANGWMPLHLPGGARLEGMTVTGERGGAGEARTFTVTLIRVKIDDADSVPLIQLKLEKESNQFSRTETVKAPGGGVVPEEYRIVNNDDFTYIIVANLEGATGPTQINSIKLVYK